jgi:tellurite methyltransferase
MWKEYYEKTQNKPPHDLLLKALRHTAGNRALDLGAGALRDSAYLVEQGYRVTAVDSAEEFVHLDTSRFDKNAFTPFHGTFRDFFEKYKPDQEFDLVNAQNAISFAPRNEIESLFQNIYKCLKKGGIFTGNVLGLDDEWNEKQDTMAFLTKDEVRSALAGLEIIYFAEVFEKALSAMGTMKKWHLFEFIVKK